MPANPFEALEKILAVRLDNIGDMVMLSPALRELRRVYPAAQITLMASPAGTQVVPLLPWVDDVITWRAVWQDISKDVTVEPEKEHALVAILEKHHFDAAFIFTSFSQSPYPPAYASYLARIPLRVGQSNEFGGGLLSHWVRPLADKTYQVERNLHLLRAVGIPIKDARMELRTSREAQSSVGELLSAHGIGDNAPFLVLAPGASAAARRYDESRYEQAALQLVSATGLPMVLIGSQHEVGKFPLLEQLAETHPRVYSFMGQTTVPELAEMIRRSALVVSNNSSSMHIAAAFQRPAVILFSGTDLKEQWAPLNANIRLLSRHTECTPCHDFQCRYNMECLDIPAKALAAVGMELLDDEAREPAAQNNSTTGVMRKVSIHDPKSTA